MIDKKLDMMYGQLLHKINGPPAQVVDSDIISGVTFFMNTDDAFSLNEPSLFLKLPQKKLELSPKNDGFIIRTVISYELASRISKDYDEGVEKVIIIKNHLLCKAATLIDFLDYDLTFARPNNSGYFRDMDDRAALELRLYVKKKKEVK